ncbi:hypothetical protein QJS10_CPB12g00272 [Acorus calamus]|uniref:Reverse transcriptase domain-containing protein n=1 Tax=Acorus calamus TaxID=4465 RepID=A0AAV9DMF6_ACOCL|nr:hypothetical protein QJS10_CPB12g00272 [Acorus calamus]
MIQSDRGEILENQDDINLYAKEYFSAHWSSKMSQIEDLPQDILPKRITEEMAAELIKPFSEQEIELVVCSLPKNKAPGPDGYPGEFYQKFWNLLKQDICQAMAQFHEKTEMPMAWGSTHIALIPKVANPKTFKDYRPISDIMHSLRVRKGRHALVAAKIDLAAAYDSVEWKSSLRFSPSVHPRFVRWMSKILRVNTSLTSWKYLGLPISGQDLSKQRRLAVQEAVS